MAKVDDKTTGGDSASGDKSTPLIGTKGDDVLTGTAGKDLIIGKSGNDIITGGAGNDTIDGGAGRDTAVFSGKFSDYNIRFNGHHDDGRGRGHDHDIDDVTITVADRRAGGDGTDTLKNIEVLRFADGEYRDGHFYPTSGGNVAPSAPAQSAPAIEGGASVTVNALGTATDANNDPLTVVNVPSPLPPGVSYNATTHSFTIDPGNAAYDSLVANATQTMVVTYGVSDGTATTPTSVSFTITGTNDTATVSSATVALNETNAPLSARGTLVVSDVDAGEAHTVAQAATAGTHGTFAIDANGAWTYTANGAHDELIANQVVTEVFTVKSQDGTGAGTVTITLTGTNDAATVSSVSVPLTEGDTAAAISTSGTLAVSDADAGEAHTVAQTTVTSYGTFVVDTDGRWTYTANGAHDELVAKQEVKEIFTVTSQDGTGAGTVTITLTGTNDAATISGMATGAVVEAGGVANADASGGPLTASGTLTVHDVDTGEEVFQTPASLIGNYGDFTFDATSGAWGYVLDAARSDVLKQAEPAYDTLTVTSVDGTATQDITVSITGTNDAPEIVGGSVTGAVFEDGPRPTSGQLVAQDVDQGAVLHWSVDEPLTTRVDYRFVADNLHITKNGGAFFDDDFGNNVPPPQAPSFAPPPNSTIGSPAQYSTSGVFLEENGRLIMDSSLTGPAVGVGSTDPFVGHFATLLSNNDSADTVRGLKSNSSFLVEGRFDLALPDELREAYGVRLSDRIAPTGLPVINAGDDTVEAVVRRGTDGVVAVQFRDVNFATDTVTSLGSVSLNAQPGEDQIVLRLSHDTPGTDVVRASFDVFAHGALTRTVAIGPVGHVFGTDTPTTTADDESWTRASIVAYAPAPVLNGTYGALSVDDSGKWTYVLNNGAANVQALAQGETATDTFTVRVTDEHDASDTQTVTVNVTGTDDAPIITGGTNFGFVVEDSSAQAAATARLTASDIDHGASLNWSLSRSPTGYSSDYRFALDDLAITKNGGAFFHDGFDGFNNGSTPLLAPNFANGTPASYQPNGARFTEQNGSLILDGSVAGSIGGAGNNNLVAGHNLLLNTNIDPSDLSRGLKIVDDFTVETRFDTNDFELHNSHQGVGISLTDRTVGGVLPDQLGNDNILLRVFRDDSGTFSIRLESRDVVADTATVLDSTVVGKEHDGSNIDHVVLRLTHQANSGVVHGSYDLISGTAVRSGEITQVAHIFGSGTPNDPSDDENWTRVQVVAFGDDPDAHTSTLQGAYGSLHIDESNGQWTYQLNNSAANVQALGQGQVATDQFSVRVTDEFGLSNQRPIFINVNGTNDAPEIVGGSATGGVFEDGPRPASGQLVAQDVDHGAVLHWAVDNPSTVSNTANYRFSVDNFRVTKNGTDLFNDDFGNNSPPPQAPNFSNGGFASYSTNGTFIETGGRAVMDGDVAGPAFPVGTTGTFVGHGALLLTSTDPANPTQGLRIGSNFDVVGTFDLVIPNEALQAYGVRLSDRIAPFGAPVINTGDDTVDVMVRHLSDGTVAVQFRDVNNVTNTVTTLESIPLNAAAGENQIVLRLSHTADHPGDIHASFGVLSSGVVTRMVSFSATGQIFGTDTANPGDDEDWTRASIAASSPAESLNGIYGSLTVQNDGQWTYQLNNGTANVQALAQGETVTDTFTARVTDEHGASDTQTVTVNVTGTDDAPIITGGTNFGIVTEDSSAQSATGRLTASDIDHGVSLNWSVSRSPTGYSSDYWFALDDLAITKNGGAFFHDGFDGFNNGSTPLLAPSGMPASYQPNGARFTEQGGNLILDGSAAGSINGVGNNNLVAAHSLLLNTNIDPSDLSRGLKIDDNFTVEASFDTNNDFRLTNPSQGVGISLTDRTVGGVLPDQLGNDNIVLRVVRDDTGTFRVQLESRDVVADTMTVLGSIVAGNDSDGQNIDHVVLRLTHEAANPGVVHGSFSLMQGGAEVRAGAINEVAHIFGTGTPDFTGDDENWTRAQVTAFGEDPGAHATTLQGAYGSLHVENDGQWTYQLNNGAANVQALIQGQSVTDNFAVRVTDEFGLSTSRPIFININGADEPGGGGGNHNPVAFNDAFSTAQNTTLNIPVSVVLANDSDSDGNLLNISSFGPATHGAVSLSNGSFSYTPNIGFSGGDSFNYTISDGHGGVASALVGINVALGGGVRISNLTAVNYPGSTYTVVMDINNHGEMVGQAGFLASPGFGPYVGWKYSGAFSTIEAGGAGINTGAEGMNDAGVVVGYYEPGNRYGFTESGGVFTLGISLPPGGSTTVDGINNSGTYVGNSYQNGGHFYSAFVHDNAGFTILNVPGVAETRANGINDAGQIVGNYTATPGSNWHGFVYDHGTYTTVDATSLGAMATFATDINSLGQIVGWYYDSAGLTHGFFDDHGVFSRIDALDGAETDVQGINDFGQIVGWYTVGGVPHGFLASVVDAGGGTGGGGTNHSPVAFNDSFVTVQNSPLNIAVSALLANDRDSDGDMLSIVGSGPASHGVVSPLNGSFSYTPNIGFSGGDSFNYTISDGHGGIASALVSINVGFGGGGGNHNPVAVNDVLDSSAVNLSGFTLNPANGHYYKFVPAGVTADQAIANAAAMGGYLVTITSAQENAFVQSLSGGGYIGASDAAEEGVWRWISGPEAGQQFWFGGSGGAAVGGHYANWRPGEPTNQGIDPVSPNNEDSAHLYPDGTWNDLPGNVLIGYTVEIGGQSAEALSSEDVVRSISTATLLANDTDSDHDFLSVVSVAPMSMHGASVLLTGTTIVYDPRYSFEIQALAQGQTLSDQFSYTILDGHGGSATATVTIPVSGADELRITSDPANPQSLTLTVAPTPPGGSITVYWGDDSSQTQNSGAGALVFSHTYAPGFHGLLNIGTAGVELPPSYYQVQVAPDHTTQRISAPDGGHPYGHPSISSDGQTVVFSNADPIFVSASDVLAYHRDTNVLELIASGSAAGPVHNRQVSIAADGNFLVYSTNYPDPDMPGYNTTASFIASTDGGIPQGILPRGSIINAGGALAVVWSTSDPTVSGDGHLVALGVAYHSLANPDALQGGIFVVDRLNSSVNLVAGLSGAYLTISADGTTIATLDGSLLAVRDLASSTTEIVPGPFAVSVLQHLSLSGDGRYLAFSDFVSNSQGSNAEVFVYDRITHDLQFIADGIAPSISADGQHVAFVQFGLASGTATGPFVQVYDRDTNTFHVVSNTAMDLFGTGQPIGGYEPSISGDGSFVAYTTPGNDVDPPQDIAIVDRHAPNAVLTGIDAGIDARDLLIGGAGNDTLTGGAGADILTGGPGADTFVYHNVNEGYDTITDFNAAQGDKLDIKDLLPVGYNPSSSVLANFVQLASDGTSTTVSVDSDGTAGAYGFQGIATLQGVTGLFLNDLLASGNLIVS